jgi:nuclear cap-binding protein subunit 1
MIGALEKEIRLSFANRIRETLPLPYQPLIPKSKDKDVPDFKYNNSGMQNYSSFWSLTKSAQTETPFAAQAQELLLAIRKKEPDTSIAPILSQITALAAETSYPDPSLPSTDAYITAICFLGSKSLSHVLSLIERCKDRLLSLGHSSPSTRHQIISSVLQYWTPAPGVGVNIIDKLLNYTILTPLSVIEWALVHPDSANEGKELCRSHIFEMLAATTSKVTNRVRQIIKSRDQDGLPPPQVELLQRTLEQERESQKELFGVIESALVGFAAPRGLDAITQEQSDLARLWARRWLAVYRRKISVEDTFLADKMAMPVITAGAGAMAVDGNGENGLNGPNGFGNGSMDVEDGD